MYKNIEITCICNYLFIFINDFAENRLCTDEDVD